jgi:hypothetical protein
MPIRSENGTFYDANLEINRWPGFRPSWLRKVATPAVVLWQAGDEPHGVVEGNAASKAAGDGKGGSCASGLTERGFCCSVLVYSPPPGDVAGSPANLVAVREEKDYIQLRGPVHNWLDHYHYEQFASRQNN